MKNFNTILILIGILSACVLLVENMVLRQQAFVYIYYSNTAMLVLVWIVTGVILWFGLKGKMSENKTNEEEDFHF